MLAELLPGNNVRHIIWSEQESAPESLHAGGAAWCYTTNHKHFKYGQITQKSNTEYACQRKYSN
jgi:hypothetical protein